MVVLLVASTTLPLIDLKRRTHPESHSGFLDRERW
jgi:hypothetical protein